MWIGARLAAVGRAEGLGASMTLLYGLGAMTQLRKGSALRPIALQKTILCPEARNTREHKQRVYRSGAGHVPWLIGFKNLHARYRRTGMLTSNCKRAQTLATETKIVEASFGAV
jgi:hypothetical protein